MSGASSFRERPSRELLGAGAGGHRPTDVQQDHVAVVGRAGVLHHAVKVGVLHAVSGLNWQNFAAQLQNFASQSAPGEDYTAYGAELAMQESAAALQKLLRQSGIESVVQPQAGGVHVRLVYPADREQAETLLQNFAGNLPYTLENTQ